MQETLANVSASFSEGFDTGSGFIDTTALQDDLDRLIGSVMVNAEKAGETARAAVKEKPKTGELADDDATKAKSSGRVFADADRRIGAGGIGYLSKQPTDPNTRAITEKLGKTNELLQKLVAKEPKRDGAPKTVHAVFAP